MKQVARNLTDASAGFLNGYRYLLHDRASLFSQDFRMILKVAGIESVRLPVRSPNLNNHASYCTSLVAFSRNGFSNAKWTGKALLFLRRIRTGRLVETFTFIAVSMGSEQTVVTPNLHRFCANL